MKFNLFILVLIILTLFVGFGFMVLPVSTLDLYGVDISQNIPGQFLARYCGSAFWGFAVLWWMARNANSVGDWKRACLLGGFVTTLAGLIVSIWGGLVGVANWLIWINTVVYILLTIGFGYYYFQKST